MAFFCWMMFVDDTGRFRRGERHKVQLVEIVGGTVTVVFLDGEQYVFPKKAVVLFPE